MLKSGSFHCLKFVKGRPFLITNPVETLKSGYFYHIKIKELLHPLFVKSWLTLQPSPPPPLPQNSTAFGAPVDMRKPCLC